MMARPPWRAVLRRLNLQNDRSRAVIYLFQSNQPQPTDPYAYASLVKALTKLSHLNRGKSVHARAITLGLEPNINLANSLIHFYMNSKGLLSYARKLFDKIPQRNIVTINSMISGFFKCGEFDNGLMLFKRVLGGDFDSGLVVNYVTLVVLVSGCVENGAFEVGKLLHSYSCKLGLGLVTEVCNVLIDLYAKFQVLDDAERVFRGMVFRDLVSWNTMVAGYARSGVCFRKAFCLFEEMRFWDIGFDGTSLLSLILACVNGRDFVAGRMVHGYIIGSGFEVTDSIGALIISMYSKFGLIESARKVFDEMVDRNIASWNSMIHGYVGCGHDKDALILFDLIKSSKVEPDEVTMLGLISACRSSGELSHGIEIQSYIESWDHLKKSIVLQNSLVDMYAKCGNMTLAKTVFDDILVKDVITWTSIIAGYAFNGEGEEALLAFSQMCASQLEPNYVTFIAVLSACDHSGLVDVGQKFYSMMCKDYNIKPMMEHCGCIVDMLARAGKLEEANEFVIKMPMEPNAVIWRMLINACRVHDDVDFGLALVGKVIEMNESPSSEDHVVSSNMYAAAGRWDNVLLERGMIMAQKAIKRAGTSSTITSKD